MDVLSLWEREKEEEKRVEGLYEIFEEEKRFASPSGKVEFLTSLHYIKKILKPGMKILDLGAGTGAYSLALEKMGYEVTALELSKRNLEIFRSSLKGDEGIHLHQGNAMDLSSFPKEFFDVVLLMGPLYHLEEESHRLRVLMEARGVMKKEGFLFVGLINHDLVALTELRRNPKWFLGDSYDQETFRLQNIPFQMFTLEESRQMLHNCDLVIQREIAADGLSELLAKEIDALDLESYEKYLNYHLLHCEDKEGLGRTNHFLFQCGQRESIHVNYLDEEPVQEELKEFLRLPVKAQGFYSFFELEKGEVNLLKLAHIPAKPEINWVPSYVFEIRHGTTPVGRIDLRLGYTQGLYFGGNIGYTIFPEYRGKGYALEACRRIKAVALKHGMEKLMITADFKNKASQRVCEKLGARYLRSIQIPKDDDLYQSGQYFENLYLWDLRE